MDPVALWSEESNQGGAHLADSVSGAGDVNGDGVADIVLGAPWYDAGSTDEGRANLYLGSATGPARSVAWSSEGDEDVALMGAAVGHAGDVNGDGFSDVIVGASGAGGRAFVFAGGCLEDLDGDGDRIGDACDACIGADESGDADLDGHCAMAADGAVADCDDDDAAVHPGAEELCDGRDNSCDGYVPPVEADADGDGTLDCAGDGDDDPSEGFGVDGPSVEDAHDMRGSAENSCAGCAASPAEGHLSPFSPILFVVSAATGLLRARPRRRWFTPRTAA
jgi:hypothetical protein